MSAGIPAQPATPAQGQTFRDALGIVSKEGKRRWIYPRKPKGPFYRWRTVLSVLLLLLFFGAPFVRVNGQPFLLCNVVDRKFILFGLVFGPHDFYLFGLALLTVIVFIILFTVVFGRLFCGWVCPQTVFMEMVFRKIDYWIEGDHRQQKRLNESGWTTEKILRKGAKHLLYLLIAFLIGNTFIAYIVGSDELLRVVTHPPSAHSAAFTGVVGFTILFYWIFSWFREQACILVCPYGRLQGVLLDRRSIVIAYDYVRGEQRGKLRRNGERINGDCVDCALCVAVCPTGIDIRNGTQLECVNCTACIDACNEVMAKVGRPQGLIRYASAEGIAANARFQWTARSVGYSLVLVLLVSVLSFLVTTRTNYDLTVLRTPGMFFQEMPDGRISNVYDVKVLNKTFGPVAITLRMQSPDGEIRLVGDPLHIAPQAASEGKILVVLDRGAVRQMNTPVTIGVYVQDVLVNVVRTSFLGPVGRP
jgi:cytochrome c oxidase accessory protein FixG